jgi:hypothetical protein
MAVKVQEHFYTVEGRVENGQIVTEWSNEQLFKTIVEDKVVVIVKNVFPAEQLIKLRETVWNWSQNTPLADKDDFLGNQHRHRCLISKLQQCPYLFHDHTFDNIPALEESFREQMYAIYEPMRKLWCGLTGQNYEFVTPPVPKGTPYFHPQITHYPSGGSFFGRHWHHLAPQYVGMILSLSSYGADYKSGSNTNFEVYGETIRTEGHHNIGDITLFPYDIPHWIDHSDPYDKFDWNNPKGRWVAILPIYDPWDEPPTTTEPEFAKKKKEELA